MPRDPKLTIHIFVRPIQTEGVFSPGMNEKFNVINGKLLQFLMEEQFENHKLQSFPCVSFFFPTPEKQLRNHALEIDDKNSPHLICHQNQMTIGIGHRARNQIMDKQPLPHKTKAPQPSNNDYNSCLPRLPLSARPPITSHLSTNISHH